MTNKPCKICGNPVSHNRYNQCLDCFHKEERLSGKAWVNREYLFQKYFVEKKSVLVIAKLTGMRDSTIHSRLIRFGIKPRTKKEAGMVVSERCKAGNHTKKFRGGKTINTCGYPSTYVGSGKNGGIYKPDHTSIAEKALGRPMREGEVVHHINNCRHDNRNENLLICDRSYHQWLHRRMGELYAKEHFPVPQEIIATIID